MKKQNPLTEYMIDEITDEMIEEILEDLPESEDIELMNTLLDVLDETGNEVPKNSSVFLKLGQDCYEKLPDTQHRNNLVRLTFLHYKDD